MTKADPNIKAADVVTFVETKISVSQTPPDLPGFELICHEGCFKKVPVYGLAVYGRPNIKFDVLSSHTVREQNDKGTTSVVQGCAIRFHKQEKKTVVITVYKSPQSKKQHLLEILDTLFSKTTMTDTILCVGDFNIDSLKDQCLKSYFRNKGLLNFLSANQITTNDMTAIDQAYSNCKVASCNCLESCDHASCNISESFTSYHRLLIIQI